MLYLLNKDVRTVRWNGDPLHEATSAIVKETMNGDFTLTVKYPISDSGIYQLIQEDMLVKAPTPVLGAQLFRIKKPVEHNDHLEITAYHISDDVMQRSITPVSVTSQSCGMALSRMVQNTKTALGDFSFNSDIQDRRTFNTTETETLYSVLLDGKHSIVGTWEGELVRDNFAMTVKKSRGENRGVVITTHKNLKDYQRTKNSQNVVTRIHAKSTFKPEGAEKETTIRVTVDSPLINSYPYINEKEYENNNAKSVEELQKWAQAKFTNQGIDKVSDAIKIEAYELDGQVVHMGDTVNLKSWKHNVDSFKKAIAYEFDALKEEYLSLTFDDKTGTGGSRASGGLSSAADAIIGVTESAQEIALEKALQNADLGFDHQAGLLRQEILDGIELARAKAEEVKRELSDTIDQRFSSFDNGPLQEIKRKAIEALQNAGASSLLAQEAKRIGLDSITKLEEFKRQAMSAQMALSGDLDVLKRTIANDVRPKQAQAEAEIAKQVEALIQTKKELAGVKSAQATYEETTTRRLSELTNLANGKASKSELTQTAEELASKLASVQASGRNLFLNSLFKQDISKTGIWTTSTYEATIDSTDKYLGHNALKIVGQNPSGRDGGNPKITYPALGQYGKVVFGSTTNQDVTISFYAKANKNGIMLRSRLGNIGYKNGNVILSTEIKRYVVHIPKNWTNWSVQTTNEWLFNFNQEGKVWIWMPKFEISDVDTSYSEAPEDIEGQISAVESSFRQRADALDAGVSRLTEGLRTKADISSLNVTAENIRQSVKSLETSTQNKLDQKLSMAEFEVRAGSIQQEILNVSKDKADKTLVTAEAGKLREEFSNLRVGGTNLLKGSKGPFLPDRKPANFDNNVLYAGQTSVHMEQGQEYIISAKTDGNFTAHHDGNKESDNVVLWIMDKDVRNYQIVSDLKTGTTGTKIIWNKPTGIYHLRVNTYHKNAVKSVWDVKIEKGNVATDWSPAPEDTDGLITEAKATFERTAQGLRTELSAIQSYVDQDGQRQEELKSYARNETITHINIYRQDVARNYILRSRYDEDARSIRQQFEAITNSQNGLIATKIANYKHSVDGKFTDISSRVTTYKQGTDNQISNLKTQVATNKDNAERQMGRISDQISANKANADSQFSNVTNQLARKVEITDFQRVRETSQLYERILGNTENGIADKVARMVMTNQLFQVEVSKASASGRNLFLNSLFKRDLRDKYSTYKLYDDNTQTKEQLAVSIDSDNQFRGVNTLKIVSTFNGKFDNQKITFSLGGNSRTGRVDELKNKSVRFSFWAKSTVNNTILQARPGYRGSLQSIPISTDWKFYDIELVRKENSNATSELILHIFTAATVWIAFPKVEIGTESTPFSEAPEDTDEAIRSVQSQLAGSWAVQNLTSAGSIVSQINATNNQILIEAEKIRLKGKTLLDELTAIQGYFKRLFVGEGTFATLNADVIRTNSITADKLVMDMAMARRFVSSDFFTDTLAAKEAFINKLRSVVVTATLLEGYRGRIGGFQIGTHDNDPSSFWLTGLDQFKVGMSNGRGREFQTAFWANWGNTWGKPGPLSWYVTLDGQMYCNNNATFHRVVDFSSTCSVNFFGANSFYKDIYMRNGSEIYGTGSTPRSGGKNSVVWWNQVGDGSVKYHIDKASDKRLKENIVDSNIVALDKIKQLKMKSFDFISSGKHEEVGLIAQEVEAVLPSVISKNPEKADDYLHIDYVAIVPYLIKSIQELNQKIEEMEKTVA